MRGTEMSEREQFYRKLRAQYGAFFEEAASIFFEIDPMHINDDVNTDEYWPEVGTILPRLCSCNSVDDVRRTIHEEFLRWFGDDAGP